MAEIVLNVEVREQSGTGGARVVRRSGLVPGVLYGGDKDPVSIAIKANEFRKALYTGKLLGHLVTLKYGDETQPVIAKAVDLHPVNEAPIHFDLYRVAANQQIKINVLVHFSHQEECPGLKRGGTLNVALHDVQVSCAADHIPDTTRLPPSTTHRSPRRRPARPGPRVPLPVPLPKAAALGKGGSGWRHR